jgi:hypothetical protein
MALKDLILNLHSEQVDSKRIVMAIKCNIVRQGYLQLFYIEGIGASSVLREQEL